MWSAAAARPLSLVYVSSKEHGLGNLGVEEFHGDTTEDLDATSRNAATVGWQASELRLEPKQNCQPRKVGGSSPHRMLTRRHAPKQQYHYHARATNKLVSNSNWRERSIRARLGAPLCSTTSRAHHHPSQGSKLPPLHAKLANWRGLARIAHHHRCTDHVIVVEAI
jgi:hypothetical protein